MGDGPAASSLAEGLGVGEAWTSEERPEHQSSGGHLPWLRSVASSGRTWDYKGKRLGLESVIMELQWGRAAMGGMSAAGQKEASRGRCEAGEVGQFLPPTSAPFLARRTRNTGWSVCLGFPVFLPQTYLY